MKSFAILNQLFGVGSGSDFGQKVPDMAGQKSPAPDPNPWKMVLPANPSLFPRPLRTDWPTLGRVLEPKNTTVLSKVRPRFFFKFCGLFRKPKL